MFHNLQSPNSFPQVIPNCIYSTQNFVLIYFQCKFLSLILQNYIGHIWTWSVWNFRATWKTMSIIISQIFSLFDFIEWEILLLSWNHPKLRPNTKWLTIPCKQFQTLWNFWRHIKYMSFTFAQNFVPIYDDHKELSLSKETNFKTKVETLDTWISLNTYLNGIKFISHM